MDQEKRFKTIEVIDSRTSQVCKVACMSCIRGHRTTSCGIAVCRSKVFWTVKRPGRPSNSCTCRYGSTGRCRCVVAKSACPHKPKKGEKRSVDCRCDEQGRYCCLLEPEHWDALTALTKPKVDFYPHREALDSRHMPQAPTTFPPTPAHSVSTPQTVYSVPSTPNLPSEGVDVINGSGLQFTDSSPSKPPTARFGMMGVGTPWGGNKYVTEDVLVWEGQAPQAPREYRPYSDFGQANDNAVSHMTPPPLPAATATSFSYISPTDAQYQNIEFTPVTQSFQQMTLPSHEPPTSAFDYDKLMNDYHNYQFPSAICQHCGLNGCSCRKCPAMLQNFETGSWAHGCARKHVQTLAPAQSAPCCMTTEAVREDAVDLHGSLVAPEQHYAMAEMQNSHDPTLSQEFDFEDLKMSDGLEPMDLSEFLVKDLEQPAHGCCCGGS